MMFRPNAARLVERARVALGRSDSESACDFLSRAIEVDPENEAALRMAGNLAVNERRWQDAVDYFLKLATISRPVAVAEQLHAGKILLFQLHRASQAEQVFRDVLKVAPTNTEATVNLTGLLVTAGRSREARPYILRLVRQGVVASDHLLVLDNPWEVVRNPAFWHECYAETPEDPQVMLGLSFVVAPDRSVPLLHEAVRRSPDLIEAQVRLGAKLIKSGDESAVRAWWDALPAACDDWARIWELKGTWAETGAQPRTAIRCYWEAVRRDPGLRRSNYQLGRLLQASDEAEMAAVFLDRAARLQSLHPRTALSMFQQTGSLAPMHDMVDSLTALGRLPEALGWCHVIRQQIPHDQTAADRFRMLAAVVAADGTSSQFAENHAMSVDLSDYPLPSWDHQSRDGSIARSGLSESTVTFADFAEPSGLVFQWHHTAAPGTLGVRMFEFTGGGVAVADFDGNGRPDIYFTQGLDEPFTTTDTAHVDQLFLNDVHDRFRDVTIPARIPGQGFGQGVSTGDFDADGFPDLYVVGIGPNRLLRNNGDGTFEEAWLTEASTDTTWTTSCLLADINADGLPDLYDVNYLAGDDLFERICVAAGQARLCLPSHFPAADDRVRFNSGDGQLRDVTTSAGFVGADGKGLGIVLADFRREGRTGIFVGNDAVPNHFYLPRGSATGDVFEEQGLTSGLALNGGGIPEACMGIAVGDIDDNGLLDLFVTNFQFETNTLYVQDVPGSFTDATRRYNLAEAGASMLGFGTQFVDADLDGDLDLLVANGHVFPATDDRSEYHMRAQLFLHHGGRYIESRAEDAGTYFEHKHLGRAMARLDWNLDGGEDVILTHLDEPVALLTNTTERRGHFVAIELRGVASDRDAVRATVELRAGDKRLMRQVTAGDGYQAGNQRLLVFGLGEHQTAEDVVVTWPSGRLSRLPTLRADSRYLLIENRPQAVCTDVVRN